MRLVPPEIIIQHFTSRAYYKYIISIQKGGLHFTFYKLLEFADFDNFGKMPIGQIHQI